VLGVRVKVRVKVSVSVRGLYVFSRDSALLGWQLGG